MSRHQSSEPGSPRPAPRGGTAAGPPPAAWLPDGAAETLLVTGSEVLRAEVECIVAAAGRQLTSVSDAAEAAPFWDAAGAVLVGSDVPELPYRRRVPAVVVGLSGEGDRLWQLAAVMGAERVAVLPEGGPWLAEYLSRYHAADPGGHVLGVVGGCGGAGATTAAVWLAQAAARHGARVLLIDGDPWGGGLELALSAEEEDGLRWPDLADASGSIDPDQFREALPDAGGFSFLSWPGKRERPVPVDTAAVSAVLDAARRSFELVLLDIGRGREVVRTFAWECDRVLVVLPAQLRAAVAAARLVPELPPVETPLAVRVRPGAAVDYELIARSVGAPVQSVLPEVRGTAAATELGRLLDAGNRRSVQRFADAVLDLTGDEYP
ncbi:septum site-determining protein Ssd [Arthrobacter sp. B3I4]|uniref:septum site-determining protein Ssd n=1 Tax=Arthrobacter sp. B3I4 TaxID=3042267 RepID=UPI002781D096|nr:septum site-determining protein Ssd [Arthrobacter sp. B3I4]MDQ0755209.1 secretion/DNA translocation related CpaE-like protein [Arthrobacter sp. B3I4]